MKLFRSDFPAGRMFFGRPYWNLGAVKECLAELPGFVEREFDEDLSVQAAYSGRGRCTPVTPGPRSAGRSPRCSASGGSFAGSRPLRNGCFIKDSTTATRNVNDPRNRPMRRFAKLIEGDYFRVESAYFRTIFAASLAKLDFPEFPSRTPTTGRSLLHCRRWRTWRRCARCRPSHSGRMSDWGEVVSAHRHHCRLGLDVRFPRWDEDSLFVKKDAGRPSGLRR